MASKAKSGMSAVRQYPESIRELTPPNDYTVGWLSFVGPVRDGKGHASIHASVSNNTTGTIKILQAWRSTGPFVQVADLATAVDPESGLFTADIVFPIVRRFVKVVFDAPGGLGVDFELGGYFEPRADSNSLQVGGASGGSSSTVVGVTQVQNIETTTPLGAGATFTGAARDCINYESFGISVFLDPDAGQALNCSIVVENSSDGGATWRNVDTITVAAAANATAAVNRVYSVCRQHYRVSVVNNDGSNGLDATEVISMLKPI